MTLNTYQAGDASTAIRFAIGQCSLGSILVAGSERGLRAILIGDDREALARDLQQGFPGVTPATGDAAFEQLLAKVEDFLDAPGSDLDVPLDVRGTAFQQKVWQALCEIPPGTTATYTEIASSIGAPNSVRAVGSACAANTLAVVIPCHRAVRRDGGLAGYRWGVERKRLLLEREARIVNAVA